MTNRKARLSCIKPHNIKHTTHTNRYKTLFTHIRTFTVFAQLFKKEPNF